MKKLFTLVALLACFMGANAANYQTVVDYECDYTTAASWAHGWINEEEHLVFEQGVGLHFQSTEAQEQFYSFQYQLHPGIQVENDVPYTITLRIKGSVAQDIHASFSGSGTPGMIPITTNWVDVVLENCVNDPNAAYFANSGCLLIQPGDYVGEFWISYIKITHEEKVQTVTWENIIKNGDASVAWANPDMDAHDSQNVTVCAWGKEWGYKMNEQNMDAQGHPMTPVPHPAIIENGVFVCHAKAVQPEMLFESDGQYSWGATWEAGTSMPHNTWQNQFWIMFPKAFSDGEPYKLEFDYKASKAVTVSTQDHVAPGDYLGGGKVGNLPFTTDWQTYSKELTAANGVQSLAFNVTGDGENWKQNIDFYFKNIKVSLMVLDEGLFVAPAGSDLDEAFSFDYDETEGLYIATVGTPGDQDSWVNAVQISTVRGNDRGFKAASLKVDGEIAGDDPDQWLTYGVSNGAKITLPAKGVWKISIDTDMQQMNFLMIEGESLGIENVVANKKASNVSYNLAGQRVSKDYKGLVIKNGKKVIVK